MLLKRGQPPLSSMLLGGGVGGDGPNANMAAVSGKCLTMLLVTSIKAGLSTNHRVVFLV